jgi:hypothetical protein
MEQRLEKELNALFGDFVCPKDFKCCTEGLENLCKAKDVDGEVHLGCLEASPSLCPFSMSFVGGHLCACHLRVYIVKMLEK